MPASNLRVLHRDEANFIYRDKRFFIGYLTWEDNRTEAWLGEITYDRATREDTKTTTDWLRIYMSSNGPEQLTNDVMGINSLHAALVEPHVGSDQAFLDLGPGDRLGYLETRYKRVGSGRCKCGEHKGGELKVVTAAKKKVQKRRRDCSESEGEACTAPDGKKRRCTFHDDYYDDGDDDEEMPPHLIKQEPKGDEATEPIATNAQPGEQLSSSVAALSVEDDLDPVRELSTPPAAPVAQAQPAQHLAEPTSHPDSAQALRTALLDRIVHWEIPTGRFKERLGEHLGTLFGLTDPAKILSGAQDLLRSAGEFCDSYTSMIALHQETMKELVKKSMPAKDIERQKRAVEECKRQRKT